MSQQLQSGMSAAQRYGSLGGSSRRSVVPLERALSFLVGFPGSGKTALVQSHPDAWILNLDLSASVVPNPLAVSWPELDPATGLAVENGVPFILTWEHVKAKIELLATLARDGKPRPSTIVFDNITMMAHLLREWIPANADKLCLSSAPAKDWKQLHGPAAYDCMYTILASLPLVLRNCGYGVVYLGHIVNDKVQMGEDRFNYSPGLTITGSLWKRIYDKFSLVAEVAREVVTDEIMVPIQKRDPKTGAVSTVGEKPKPVKRDRFYVTSSVVTNPDLAGILKDRVGLPASIEIPLGRGWATLSKAFDEAAHAQSQESTPNE